jgi:hypothetical protein
MAATVSISSAAQRERSVPLGEALTQKAVRVSLGLLHADLMALNHSLRRNINSSRNYERRIDLTMRRLGAQS